jgi:hypothetical protein
MQVSSCYTPIEGVGLREGADHAMMMAVVRKFGTVHIDTSLNGTFLMAPSSHTAHLKQGVHIVNILMNHENMRRAGKYSKPIPI